MVDEGFSFFDKMMKVYRIVPKIEHYGCMVDLLGRAGLVQQAYDYICKMPIQPNDVIWRTLLASERRWSDVHTMRKVILKEGVKKVPGQSLVELGNRVHEFVMGDTSHAQTDAIYGVLLEMMKLLRL
ncbi:hypothetical protein ACS0TY_000145 [Phlomoides rotata]